MMAHRVLWFVSGAVLAFLAGLGVLVAASHGFSAREQPGPLETWFARRVRSAAIPREAASRRNPIPQTPDVLAAARAHWADHCAACHANDGSGEAAMGRNTYPPAPDMRLAATQRKTDGELLFIIENGIRFSAMPAWGNGSARDTEDSWKLVHFIRHLPGLTAAEKSEMEKLNPKSPEEIREELEEERFLKGEDVHEPQTHHHR